MADTGERWFSVSYDSTAKVISWVVAAVLATVAVASQTWPAAGLAVVILCLTYAYSPRGYSLTNDSIVVRRLIGNVVIPLHGLREVRRATRDDLKGSLRLWGSGGLFGYFGLFRTTALGKCTWYVTNRDNAVVVVTDSKTVVFSPDDVEAFTGMIRDSRPVPGRLPPRASSGVRGGVIVTAAAVALIGSVVAGLYYSPGLPGYTITAGSVTIHDRFYPVTLSTGQIDIDGARIVDLTAEHEWRPVARTNGFGNLRYRSGWFRLANGQKVRMYREQGTRLVLLPGLAGGPTVLYEVGDPERFLRELRAARRALHAM